jgi:glycerophosphoryl diester phosphodiesterase
MDPDISSPAIALVGLLSLFIFGCAAQKGAVRPAPPFAGLTGPLIIAHRGGSLEAPENTVSSLTHGVEVGADWQECDVTLTRDEEIVVIHDDTLERTTNGQGKADEKTLAEFKALSAGRPRPAELTAARLAERHITPPDFGDRFLNERIPTLAEVLEIPDGRLMIELKRSKRGELLTRKVIELIQKRGAASRVMLASFDETLLWAAYNNDPTLPLLGLVDDEDSLQRMLLLPVSVLGVRADWAARALDVAPPTVAIWTWTVFDLRMAEELAALGVHGLITDVPTELVKAMRKVPALNIRPGEDEP